MFTGIITDIGAISSRQADEDGCLRIRIACRPDTADAEIGASIACSGVCLTVVERGADGAQGWFDAEVSRETLDKTAAPNWAAGARLNLERALKVGDELGGHIVSGHVDGTAEIVETHAEEGSIRIRFRAPPALARFIAPKGSVALDGVSLTVNEVEGCEFGVNLIPHTQDMTTFAGAAVGRVVNLEIDTLARYVARLAETENMA
ncbi:riboflavin synthase [Rhodovulum sp. DZ06]|uniref:riboflavin synthase n=1 Tax=Rhodovulum sp. DZ06 TaxID=3425126 RepID=UPI003D334F0A